MANHASGDATSALYETDRNGNAILVLRDGKDMKMGEELTITYGDEKGACEMLFSYGFIDANMTCARELFLDLEILDDDPLKLAKKAVSRSAPGFRLFLYNDSMGWESSFVWIVCVNEEDGLNFKMLQKNDGERELQASWKGKEITDMSKLDIVLRSEPLWDIFELRAISTLQSRVEQQLFRLEDSKKYVARLEAENAEIGNCQNATRLRDMEETLMLHAYEDLEMKVWNDCIAKIRV